MIVKLYDDHREVQERDGRSIIRAKKRKKKEKEKGK